MSARDMADHTAGLGTLRITVTESDDGRTVVALAGELDLGTVPMFVDSIDEILVDAPAHIELDLGQLSFIDSSGVGAYVTAYRRAQAKGSQMSIGARSARVDRVLQLSGVEEALAAEADGGT